MSWFFESCGLGVVGIGGSMGVGWRVAGGLAVGGFFVANALGTGA